MSANSPSTIIYQDPHPIFCSDGNPRMACTLQLLPRKCQGMSHYNLARPWKQKDCVMFGAPCELNRVEGSLGCQIFFIFVEGD